MTDNHTDERSPAVTVSPQTEDVSPQTEEIPDSTAAELGATEATPKTEKTRRRISISVRSLLVAVVMAILAGAVGVLTWLYIGAEGQVASHAQQSANNTRAEEIALDYAVSAAEMNFKDLATWKTKLVKGTSPELEEKLTQAANSMEQIIMPLQWNSTARPLLAKVRSESGGIYVVDAFVNVLTKTVQAPDGLQSTATYSVTLDSNNNWQITDVGGLDAVMPPG